MANDLQMQISSDVGRALSGLNAVDSKVQQLTKSTSGLNKANHEFQRTASEAFKGAHGHATTLAGKIGAVAHALALAGGEVGHISHEFRRFSTVANDGHSGLTRLAAAAGIAGIAYEAMAASSEHFIKMLEKEQEEEEKLLRIREAANKKLESRAEHGLSQADSVKRLNLLGGPDAVKVAQTLATKSSNQLMGISQADAYKGTELLYSKFKDDKTRGRASAAAQEYAMAGGNYVEGITQMIAHPAIRNRLKQDGDGGAIVADVASMLQGIAISGGRVVQPNRRRLGFSIGDAANNPLIQAGNQATFLENQDDERQRVLAEKMGVGAVRKRLSAEANPEAAAIAENNRKHDEHMAQLREQIKEAAASKNILTKIHAAMLIQQYRQEQISYSRAQFNGADEPLDDTTGGKE